MLEKLENQVGEMDRKGRIHVAASDRINATSNAALWEQRHCCCRCWTPHMPASTSAIVGTKYSALHIYSAASAIAAPISRSLVTLQLLMELMFHVLCPKFTNSQLSPREHKLIRVRFHTMNVAARGAKTLMSILQKISFSSIETPSV